ncbi:hypothetical protein [Staphylococcus xylosus]|uniref:hypothetical protein n=1 Tax=Staphylococcus xylosus TaxID=1288 RepID=UPI002DB716AE|nr:hypothetical protein [Staphylococcus xylosus]MEB7507164.1 hypothetical protein [Staphylococcus xylosus]
MEDLIIATMFIVTVICYTVYKIDCNHVKNRRTISKNVPSRKEANPPAPPKIKTESGRPSEETMESLFGKDYKEDK